MESIPIEMTLFFIFVSSKSHRGGRPPLSPPAPRWRRHWVLHCYLIDFKYHHYTNKKYKHVVASQQSIGIYRDESIIPASRLNQAAKSSFSAACQHPYHECSMILWTKQIILSSFGLLFWDLSLCKVGRTLYELHMTKHPTPNAIAISLPDTGICQH